MNLSCIATSYPIDRHSDYISILNKEHWLRHQQCDPHINACFIMPSFICPLTLHSSVLKLKSQVVSF